MAKKAEERKENEIEAGSVKKKKKKKRNGNSCASEETVVKEEQELGGGGKKKKKKKKKNGNSCASEETVVKTPKSKTKLVSASRKRERQKRTITSQSHMEKVISSFFDEKLQDEFKVFLQERSKVIPITSKMKKASKKKQEGTEPVSFRERTSFGNPNFQAGTIGEEYNPDEIDITTYDIMRKDFQLAAGLAVIKMPIIALPWSIHSDDQKIAKTVEWALKKVWGKLINSSLLAIDYGFATHEKVWTRSNVKISSIDKEDNETVYYKGDLVYWKKIKPNHPESIKMKFNEKQDLLEVIQEPRTGGEEVALPLRKVFLFTNDAEFGNPFGVSRLKNAYTVWYWKELLYQFMMQYYERRGTPPVITTAPPGKAVDSAGNEMDNAEMALRLASSLISTSVATIPYRADKQTGKNMWSLDVLKDDARGPMFVEAMKHLDTRCLRALYVPENIFTQEGGGGYSSASIHADLFLMTEKAIVTDFEEAVNAQLIEPFVNANFPPEKRRAAYLKMDPLDWNRKIALKELFIEMLRNIDTMISEGIAPTTVPDLDKMAAILEIPMETWKDHVGGTIPIRKDPNNQEKDIQKKGIEQK